MSQQDAERSWLESITGTVKESLANAPKQIAEELVHKFEQGKHELGAALFQGHAFVMYPRAQQGVEQSLERALEQPVQPVQEQSNTQEQERGGRGR
jgi:hypothetical protein